MNRKHPLKGSDLEGKVWVFPSIDAARAVYQTVLATTGFVSDKHDSSLQTVFFGGQPFLVFLWAPNMDSGLVSRVERLAVDAGGNELMEESTAEILRQTRLRWRVMRKPEGGTIIKHHPQGKRWTDLRD